MIFHENCLLADNSHVISYLIFVENWERFPKILSSAAVVIGALRVKTGHHRPANERQVNGWLYAVWLEVTFVVGFANSLDSDPNRFIH